MLRIKEHFLLFLSKFKTNSKKVFKKIIQKKKSKIKNKIPNQSNRSKRENAAAYLEQASVGRLTAMGEALKFA